VGRAHRPCAGARLAAVEASPTDLARAHELLSAASSVTVLTGAGISTDSGIPDFRGPNGVWTKNPEAERMATLQVYLDDPDVRRRAWQNRLKSPTWNAAPNDGHRALVTLERRGILHTLVTQNVDGLHHEAGTDPERIVEIHGTMREVMCLSCGDRTPMAEVLDRVRAGEADPPCEAPHRGSVCGGILKSAAISFGQNLVLDDLLRAERAAQECDVFLAVGSSLGVYPAAGLVPTAHMAGAQVVIVNAEPTDYDAIAGAVLRGSISEVLPAILESDDPPR
jgi:NAD-dependent deacetylase